MSSMQPATRPLTGLRARNHAARRQAFLDAAREVVTLDGVDGLTMQRVAAELESGVGSIYRYFPSKGALLAAVEHEQLATLRAELEAAQQRFDDHDRAVVERLGSAAPAGVATALARVVAVGRSWVDAAGPLRAELDTARRLASSSVPSRSPAPSPVTAEPTEVDAIVELLRQPLDAAVAAGALAPDDNEARVRVLMAAVADAVLTTATPAFGSQLLACLLVAWGADPQLLARVDDLLTEAQS